jgi:acid phosphatase
MALRLPRDALVPLLVLLLVVVHATDATQRLEMVTSSAPARGGTGAGTTSRARVAASSCASWRLGVETNNIRAWYSIPAACRGYVSDYMFGEQFRQDCAVVAREAAAYAEGLALAGDGREAWVFDVDDTALTNLPYYADTGFGAEPYNATYFEEYVANATAPALPEVLGLYGKLLALGIKVVFITGRHDYEREPTVKNLRSAGYHTWEKLVLKCVRDSLPLLLYPFIYLLLADCSVSIVHMALSESYYLRSRRSPLPLVKTISLYENSYEILPKN